MNDRQESKLDMFQRVLNTCKNYNQVYAKIPVFVQSVGELEDTVEAISQNSKRQASSISTGVTVTKALALEQLVRSCIKVADLVYVYAFRTKKHELLPKVSINKHMLYHGRDNDAITLASIVADEASEHAAELVDYGVEAQDLTELNEAIGQFRTFLSKPKQVIGERTLHTKNLKELFSDADSILCDQLDKLIGKFRESEPEFFTLYKNSRNVINTAARKRKNDSGKDDENNN